MSKEYDHMTPTEGHSPLANIGPSLPTNKDIAIQIIATFLHNPHPNQRKNYDREKKAFAEGAKWMRGEIEKQNKGNEA